MTRRYEQLADRMRANGGTLRPHKLARLGRRPEMIAALLRFNEFQRNLEIRETGPQLVLSCEALEEFGRKFGG